MGYCDLHFRSRCPADDPLLDCNRVECFKESRHCASKFAGTSGNAPKMAPKSFALAPVGISPPGARVARYSLYNSTVFNASPRVSKLYQAGVMAGVQ